MLDVIVGAVLATALIYTGRCWGRQEQHIYIRVDKLPEAPRDKVLFSESAYAQMRQNGRATVYRQGGGHG